MTYELILSILFGLLSGVVLIVFLHLEAARKAARRRREMVRHIAWTLAGRDERESFDQYWKV